MTIFVKTDRPNSLLKRIWKDIDDGNVDTWRYDDDGDFTHSPKQWDGKAWLEPTIATGYLRFHILESQSFPLTDVINGVYHGRFCEMLVTHYDDRFDWIRIRV